MVAAYGRLGQGTLALAPSQATPARPAQARRAWAPDRPWACQACPGPLALGT
eukprot:NODE_9415_length_475_cov_3.946009_g8328_i0.p4 GENE.NODE_9415_length_475_cov_3.946009_g8328_i0~~NODE_9415_length_475_cov_3.946009_g8328_i0.p4  ORF type:complete len:52 (+),score=1.38 NODE_9415_length_475_cov_3.946009_g8328_i0:139-294(+)